MLLAPESVQELVPPSAPARLTPRRVLIVAPHFPPVNAPDGQRARMVLPHLAENGWVAEILTVRPEFVEAPRDPDLAATLPADVAIHRVMALSPRATRRMGWSSLARRAYPYLKQRGGALLAGGRFDLVFFSTCQFGVLPLGPSWLRRHGVPYVLDFHDEWAGDYYSKNPRTKPPGGRIKYALSHALSRWQEGKVVRQAAQIISVSPRYNINLLSRHRRLDPSRFHVLPFGAPEKDLEMLKKRRFDHDFFRPGAGVNWVYAGRGGPGMQRAARAFFLAVRRALSENLVPPGLCLHFIGTDYATGDRARKTFEPLARELCPEIPVFEQTARVPHFTALQCLRDADAIVIFGSDDPGYSASKLLACLQVRRPLLSILHQDSPLIQTLKETKGGKVVSFASDENPDTFARRICADWFAAQGYRRYPHPNAAALARHESRAMTHQLASIFSDACGRRKNRA